MARFVVRCSERAGVDVMEASWPAERGCTERFKGKPASIYASHQRSAAAIVLPRKKEEQMIKRFLPIAGVCGLLSVALAGTAAAGGGGGYGGPGPFQFSDTPAHATFCGPDLGGHLTKVY